MLTPPSSLTTDRILLRIPEPDDAEAIFTEYAHDPEVTKYLVWTPHQDIETTKASVNRFIEAWKNGRSFPWVVIIKETNKLIGMIELRIDLPKADFGYVFAKNVWGKGYATEAARAVLNWAKSQEEIHLIWATCDIDNIASAKVLEKAGMRKTGIIPHHIVHPNLSPDPRDSYCYEIERGIDY